MADAKKKLMKGVAVATLIAGAVALTQALKKNRKSKILKEAAVDAKESVLAHARKLGKLSKGSYARIVDAVMDEYAAIKALSKSELSALSDELKDGWKDAGEAMGNDAKKKGNGKA